MSGSLHHISVFLMKNKLPHGNQYKKYEVLSRFLEKVDRKSDQECWLWTGSKVNRGYGQFKFTPTKNISAHRSAYLLMIGEIPDGLHVCHKCDVKTCVNPSHLFLGTGEENHEDKRLKGRARNQHWRVNMSICIRGHTDAWAVTPNGTRYCKRCARERRIIRPI